MPAGPKREDNIIRTFLSAHEDKFWEGIEPEFPDKTKDGGIDAYIEKDRRSLAIEHTLIEPFVGERDDLAQFWPAFEKIQEDRSLSVPDRITNINVPVGTLKNRKGKAGEVIVDGIHDWLKSNMNLFPDGWSDQTCAVALSGKAPLNVILTVEVISTPEFSAFKIARQQVKTDLNKVVEKALSMKLPKLIRAEADKRILMLERQHGNLFPQQILDEIEKLRLSMPDLGHVDDIWLVETIAYEREGILFFYRYDSNSKLTGQISAVNGNVRSRWEEPMPYAVVER